MVLAWLLFPAVATVLCLGCGLLIDSAAGFRLSGPLLVPLGFAVLVVATQLLTWRSETVPLAAPAVVVLALGGLAAGRERLRMARLSWEVVTGCATFLAFAAPVLALGRATFGGYGALGDSAVHFVLIDQLYAHGHDLSSVDPSSYRTTLDGYLAGGYPTGADTPLGALRALLPVDVAWLFQPYIAFLAAALSLVAYELLGWCFTRPWIRASAAFVVAQPALVYAEAAQGSLKEIAAILLLGLACALTTSQLAIEAGVRRLLPTAITAAAALAVLSFGAAPMFGCLLLGQTAALVIIHRRRGTRAAAAREVTGLAALISLPALPVIAAGHTFFPIATSVLTAQRELGNLLYPLKTLQVFGIWPTGDHRLRLTTDVLEARVLIAVAAGAALLGAAWCAWRRVLAPSLYIGASLAGGGIVLLLAGSPWADSKALTIASPAVLLAAAFGVSALNATGLRLFAPVVAIAIAGGVLWSNVRAYGSFDPAPRSRLVELEKTRHKVAAKPALVVEFEESAKHFLRDTAIVASDASVPASYATRRPRFGLPVPLASLPPSYLARFGALIVRRSPLASRPPTSFSLSWAGTWYEVWNRRPGMSVRRHLELNLGADPASVPACGRIRALAQRATAGDRLVAAVRPAVAEFVPSRHPFPPRWAVDRTEPDVLLPDGAGTVSGPLRVTASRNYTVWVEGSFGPKVQVSIDGRTVGSVSDLLDGRDQFTRIGSVRLSAGRHRLRLAVAAAGLHPGDGVAGERRLGRVVLGGQDAESSHLVEEAPHNWRRLCGRRLDWLELVDRH